MEIQSLLAASPTLPPPLRLRRTWKTVRPNFLCRWKDSENRALARKIIRQWKQDRGFDQKDSDATCAALVKALSQKRMPRLAQEVLLEMKSEGFLPSTSALSALMLCYAGNGLLQQAQAIWEEIINSSFVPSIQIVSELFDAYGKMGQFDDVAKIVDQVSSRDFNLLPEVYSLAISCFGKGGQLELMENTLKKMVSRGYSIDSSTGNAFIKYYSIFGSLREMENAYSHLKRSRLLLEKEGIRAISFAYIKERKFYKLGEFLRDVGLARTNVGNLLWNLLLLSYAANFKMKSLQREFVRMVEAGFHPDLNTFNIRSLAFSRMSLLWDLHLSLEHMRHEQISPDLVTYGCFVDAYIDRRLGRNLYFALNKMNLDDSPLLLTDPFVFEALGKGDFQSSSEAFLEFKSRREWTYRKLVAVYLKKQCRRDQIFWNY